MSASAETLRRFTPGERGLEQSFGRAAAILNALSDVGDTGLRFVDIVRVSGFSQTTVHRLVAALAEHGFIEQDPVSGRYFLGMRLAGWAFAAANRFSLAEVAHPIMQALSAETEDSVFLTIRSGDMATCVAQIEGSYPIRALVVKPGDRRPLGLGASAVVLLAFMKDPAEIERVLSMPEHRAGCAARGVDQAQVRRWIAEAQHDGYASVQDLVPGTAGIALPIFGPSGNPVAALSLAAIAPRLAPPRREEVLQRLRAATAELEARLQPLLKARAPL
jgi:DNA-binding IclR family transcriptional regulator